MSSSVLALASTPRHGRTDPTIDRYIGRDAMNAGVFQFVPARNAPHRLGCTDVKRGGLSRSAGGVFCGPCVARHKGRWVGAASGTLRSKRREGLDFEDPPQTNH